MVETDTPSPPWQVSEWLNTPHPVTLAGLRGKVVVLHAFQMLCPGCVSDGLPQAARINAIFPSERVAVIGLHTVFEHHDVMGPKALRAFLSEYRMCSQRKTFSEHLTTGWGPARHDTLEEFWRKCPWPRTCLHR